MKIIAEAEFTDEMTGSPRLLRLSLQGKDVFIEIDQEEENQWSGFFIDRNEFYKMLSILFPEDFVNSLPLADKSE